MKSALPMTGDEATAYAMKQINPDVVAAYPITPQTEIVQIFSEYVANGEVNTEFVAVESEHSAMSVCIGASASGARSMTATSSQGLALMVELCYIASSFRLPIVMPVANRALNSNLNIHCDHTDAMLSRDAGWIQIFCENAQEVYDNVIQAVKIGENPNVMLPVMVNLDGFIITHGMEPVEIIEDEKIKNFIGEYKTPYTLLDHKNPITLGPMDLYDWYFEHKRQQIEVYNNVLPVITQVSDDFCQLTGRKYGFFKEYKVSDCDVCIIVMGSTGGTARHTVDLLRNEGLKVGLINIRTFRPFPSRELAETIKSVKAIAVLDRAVSYGAFGSPLYLDVINSVSKLEEKPLVVNYIYGLGGRDTNVNLIKSVYQDLFEIVKTKKIDEKIKYLGVRN